MKMMSERFYLMLIVTLPAIVCVVKNLLSMGCRL